MNRIFHSVTIFQLLFFGIRGQYIQSPCPDVFDYRSDGTNVYGVIRLIPNGPLSSVLTRVNFTIAAHLPSQYVGSLEPVGSDLLLIQEFNRGVPITYRVNFPVTSPLPRLTALVVNDKLLCYGSGDIAGPNQYVTTISLQHKLFLKSNSGISGPEGFQFKPQSKPENDFEYLGPFPGDGQVFTINEDKDSGVGNKNQIFYPFVDNNSRPAIDRPVNRPPAQAVPDYPQFVYTEQTTQKFKPRPTFERPRPTFERPKPTFERPKPTFERPNRPPPQVVPDYLQFEYTEQTSQASKPQPATEASTQPPPPPPTSSPVLSAPIQCGVISGGNERLPLIYNGQGYSRGDWPWLVAIYKRKDGSLTFICSGTLISERHIITAAHCVQQKNTFTTIKDIVVKVGVYNLEDWGDDITVTRTLTAASIHESYNASTLANDISLFTFERSVEFNVNIRPACLWNGNSDLSRIVGASGVVAGWGKSELGPEGHGEPRMVRIPIVSTSTCRASRPEFHKLTTANTLCAGDRNGVGPCLGDSGGGLYILDNGRWRLRGIVSLSLRPDSGDNTCNLNEYIVFTDTAKYLKWIKNAMAT